MLFSARSWREFVCTNEYIRTTLAGHILETRVHLDTLYRDGHFVDLDDFVIFLPFLLTARDRPRYF